MRTLTILMFGIVVALAMGACAAPATEPPAPPAAPATAAAQASAPTEAASTEEKPAQGEAAQDTAAEPMPTEAATEETATAEEAAVPTEAAPIEAAPTEAAPAEAAPTEAEPAVVERPAWQQIVLTDAATGQPFTLADFAGKTVFVEPFATWCSNCRQQLGNVQAARAQLGDDVVFVTLSVEPNIGNEALVQYTVETGFDWTFAAMPPEMLQALAGIFGQTVANPPATPHFIIRPDGSFTELVTGIEGAEAIVEAVEEARGG